MALGYPHPDALLAVLTSRQVAEWQAYASLYGLPEFRQDFRAGQICAVQANIHRGKESPVYGPADFMPLLAPPPEPKPADGPLDIAASSSALEALLGKPKDNGNDR